MLAEYKILYFCNYFFHKYFLKGSQSEKYNFCFIASSVSWCPPHILDLKKSATFNLWWKYIKQVKYSQSKFSITSNNTFQTLCFSYLHGLLHVYDAKRIPAALQV